MTQKSRFAEAQAHAQHRDGRVLRLLVGWPVPRAAVAADSVRRSDARRRWGLATDLRNSDDRLSTDLQIGRHGHDAPAHLLIVDQSQLLEHGPSMFLDRRAAQENVVAMVALLRPAAILWGTSRSRWAVASLAESDHHSLLSRDFAPRCGHASISIV